MLRRALGIKILHNRFSNFLKCCKEAFKKFCNKISRYTSTRREMGNKWVKPNFVNV